MQSFLRAGHTFLAGVGSSGGEIPFEFSRRFA